MSFFVHDTAIVDGNAKIGLNTKIWHFSHVMGNCEVGENCVFGQNTFIASNVKIGNNCKVQNNVSIYEGVTLEDDVFVGPSVVFTNVNNPRSFIERKTEYRPTLLKKGVSLGANVTVICGVTLGEYSFIGAGTTVSKDAKPFGLYYGSPMQHQGWVSKAGHKLEMKGNRANCPETGEKYLLKNDNLFLDEE
jgi:UDP-2-acetamido-3-amino-2,3-dideoxy-glucuronate N-acetyltransferase